VNLVLDASAGFELLVETKTGQRLLDQVPSGAEWWVPEHYFLETAAALRRAELRGVVASAAAQAAAARLRVSRVHRVQVLPLLDEAWRRRGHLTIGDALYVVLAEELDAVLVTGDVKLAGSPGLPVPTITP
jgi:predicted nucleic acid-binding protein